MGRFGLGGARSLGLSLGVRVDGGVGAALGLRLLGAYWLGLGGRAVLSGGLWGLCWAGGSGASLGEAPSLGGPVR